MAFQMLNIYVNYLQKRCKEIKSLTSLKNKIDKEEKAANFVKTYLDFAYFAVRW